MCQDWGPAMNSQEEWARRWRETFMRGVSQAIDLRTMIYTGDQAESLATQAVEKAEETAKAEEKEPLSEEEKARLWRAVLESCSG